MGHWISRLALIACATLAGVRSLRDRFVFGAVAGLVVVLLTLADLVRPESYFVTIGAASAASLVALLVSWSRERDLPAAQTRGRDLMFPFIGCAASSVGGLALTALAHSLSEP